MKLEDYLEKELMESREFADESILSDLYLTSLSMSQRELKSRSDRIDSESNERKKGQLRKEYEEEVEKQNWLLQECEKIREVNTLSFDQLKKQADAQKKSCDAYFYNPNTEDNKRNLLIEFKNVNKSKILEFIKSDDKDGLLRKVTDSAALLKNAVEFDGYTCEQIISNTHLMIVYGEKADAVSVMHMNLGRREKIEKDRRGRQSRAVKIDRQFNKEYSVKGTKAVLDEFSDKIKAKGFAPCPKGYFGVPIKEPDQDKSGGEKGCWYTLYSKGDFQRVVSEAGFFENWDWGVYGRYFKGKNV